MLRSLARSFGGSIASTRAVALAAVCVLAPASIVLAQDGANDPTFAIGTGADAPVRALASLPSGQTWIGGNFANFDGVPRSRIARLNADGTLDPTFVAASDVNGSVATIAPLADGRVFAAGQFTEWDGVITRRMVRLNADGSRDSSFVATSGPNDWVHGCVVQPDGKAILVGSFDRYGFVPRPAIMRVDVDGSLDTTFDPGTGATSIRHVALDAQGRILIGGTFTQFDGVARKNVARLLDDGSVDATFDTSTGPEGQVWTVLALADGRVLIGGAFTSTHGVARPRLAMLHADGSLDTSFDTGAGPDGPVFGIARQPDGKFLVTGDFDSFAGLPCAGLVRVHANGAADATFDAGAGTGVGEVVQPIALQSDGKAVIAGAFTQYDGALRNHVARIRAVEPFTSFCSGDGTGAACPCGNVGAPGHGCASSVNAAGAVLTCGGTSSITNDTFTLWGSGMPNGFALYFQGTASSNGDLGVPFGDGLRCVAGSVKRLGVRPNVAGASSYPAPGDPSVSTRGAIDAPGVRLYQAWYRNAAAYCTTSTFNLTQGVRVLWWP